MIVYVKSAAEFDDVVKSGKVLVDFWAPWCGPCRMLGPVLEEIDASNDGSFTIAKVNVDDLGEIASRFSIYSIPTMILFKDGKAAATKVGYVPRGPLERFIQGN